MHSKLDIKEKNTQDNFGIDRFANNGNMKRIIPIAVLAIVVGIGLTLTTSPKTITAQTTSNNNNNNNKPIIIHVHPHLKLTVDGKPVTVPAQIGIAPSLWKDHSLDRYGMQAMNMFMPAMAPLGTGNNSGVIGVATSGNRSYTLQDFLKIWGIDLKHKNMAVSVDGKPITDFKDYVLSNGARLNMTIDGKPVTVPANIGIDPSLWKDHSFDKYGMQSMTMVMPGMAPLHTHDTSGIIHLESNTVRLYTLGEFLNIWGGLDTNGKAVKATMDSAPVSDYKNIILRDGEQISLDVER